MSPAALLQTPQCAVDMKARLVAGRPWAHHLALRVAGARLGSNRVAAPLGGLLPLQRRKGRKWMIGGLAVGVRAFAGDDFGLGWPRDFDSRYRVQDEVLGEGSFGTVKVALGEDGERVAVKMLAKSRGKGADWERYMALLRNEVALWTAVQNSHDKHVARLHGVYEDDEYVYLVQDICEGGDLQHLMKEQGCLGEREAAQAISGVLSMLAACHDRNICYGDVKPANFLLTAPYPCRRHMVDPTAPKGDIVLQGVDFGCSQKLNDRDRLNKRTGTPLYMAPEILFGWYGMEVDMWAAGMMLYQLISGKLPFFGEKAEEFTKAPKMLIVQALMDNELEMTGGVWDKVSEEAKDLISKLLDVDYNTRISARAALQHAWIQRYCDHPSIFYTSKPAEDMRIRTL